MTRALPSFSRAATARNLWRLGLGATYRVSVHGVAHLAQPTLIITNDAGPLTTPLLRSALPWPVHVLGADIDSPPPGLAAVDQAITAVIAGRSVVVREPTTAAAAIAVSTGVPITVMRIDGAQARIPTDPARPGSAITITVLATTPGLARNPMPTAAQIRVAHEVLRQRVTDVHGEAA